MRADEVAEYKLPDGRRVYAPVGGHDLSFLYAEIFIDRSYEREGITLTNARVVLDVGSNIGLFALRVNDVAPEARVFCFEPTPVTCACLRRNARAEVHELALSNREGKLELTYYPRSPGNATSHPELKHTEARAFADAATLPWVWRFNKAAAVILTLFYPLRRAILRTAFAKVYDRPRNFTAQTTSLDTIIREREIDSIDLLKIDVEGAERQVLAGISDENLTKVRQLVVEITPAFRRNYIPELEARLRKLGFKHVAVRSILPSDDVPCTLYARS